MTSVFPPVLETRGRHRRRATPVVLSVAPFLLLSRCLCSLRYLRSSRGSGELEFLDQAIEVRSSVRKLVMHARRTRSPAEHDIRDPHVATGIDRLQDVAGGQLLRPDVVVREADQREHRVVGDRPPGPRASRAAGRHAGLAIDCSARTSRSASDMTSGRSRVSTTAPWPCRDRLFQRPWSRACTTGHIECIANGAGMTAEEHPGAHRHRQPLVRVPRHRVGSLDPVQRRTQARHQHGGASPRGVHMKPAPHRAAMSASAGSGSTTPPPVVPAVPTIMNGQRPASTSRPIRSLSAETSSPNRLVVATSDNTSVPSPLMRATFRKEW